MAPQTHNIDVGIRTIVMQDAKRRVAKIRRHERLTIGVPTTTMASVGRDILTNWKPEYTQAVGEVEGLPVDAAGNRLTERGHRKYAKDDRDKVPERGRDAPNFVRATQLLDHLRTVADPRRGTTLGPIAAVRKAAKADGLLNYEIEGKTLLRHIGAAERAVLKPLRFTLPMRVYETITKRLADAGCTVTRALEVGLEEFARTGETTPKTDPEG